jgi:hypothetical protein
VAFDQGRRSIHLILSKKYGENAAKARGLQKTKTQVLGRVAAGVKAMQNPV